MSLRRLCRTAEIREGEVRDFRWGEGAEQRAVFVLRKGGVLYAYANACPHIGTPLNWLPNRFFDRHGELLLCGTHGALFRPEDGYCLRGPCAGKWLTRAPIRVEDGEIVLAD